MAAPPRQQVFPGDSGAGVWKQYAGEAVSDADPVPAKTTSAIEERISRSPYKEMDIFRKSVLLGSMGCGFTYGDAYENASGQLTLTYKMPLEL